MEFVVRQARQHSRLLKQYRAYAKSMSTTAAASALLTCVDLRTTFQPCASSAEAATFHLQDAVLQPATCPYACCLSSSS